ncbi:MAG: N,N-dimethylformamidase [Rhodospirillaceae bacterium]|nr:N,N-dimethylformamidase [Rhodospirillaceae bacterium]
MDRKTIVGYSDKISVRPGEKLTVMVSSDEGRDFEARLVRLIHGDTNPEGPGYRDEAVACDADGRHPGRRQQTLIGGCAVVPSGPRFAALASFTVQAMIWPTTPGKGAQSILSLWDGGRWAGFILGIDGSGALALTMGDGSGTVETVSSGVPLLEREWYMAAAGYDAATGRVWLLQEPMVRYAHVEHGAEVERAVGLKPGPFTAPFVMAAHYVEARGDRIVTAGHYNGKIDGPALAAAVLSRVEMEQLRAGLISEAVRPVLVARWEFGRDIDSERVRDIGPNRLDGETVNLPARGMKGWNWSGRAQSWRDAPEEYGAIHFHDDDLYDAGWEPSFTLTVPEMARSGLYAVHLSTGAGEADEDHVPFVVRPRRGEENKIAFLVPTASYMAYANDRNALGLLTQLVIGRLVTLQPQDLFLNDHPEFAASLYDTHSDGSGVCYSSRLRPIVNMRPKYPSWLGAKGSGLWQFNADTHIIAWLEAKGYAYDCISDEDLHHEGLDALRPYRVVITGSHPEYWSLPMWDALEAWKRLGGRLMYLGANGWYWRIAYHPSKPGVIEVRRAEDGIRTWAAEPGEYYHSFTGEYGGLWRRNGRPPQLMAGVGFTAQGFDVCSYYRRKPGSHDPRAAFIFEGVEDEIIGDFGLVGGGAAGLELDRADRALGTPPDALVLASSEDHTDVYVVVTEEILVNHPAMGGQENELVRADLVFYETPAGGAVFSTGSIAWAGSLSHNNYDNNVARITGNVLDRFLDPTPFGPGSTPRQSRKNSAT